MRTERGFSLVELLIVVLLVGVLTALSVQGYTKSKQQTQADNAKATLSAIAQAAQAYYIRCHGQWPQSFTSCCNQSGSACMGDLLPNMNWNAGISGTYAVYGPYNYSLNQGSGGLIAEATRINPVPSYPQFNCFKILTTGQCQDCSGAACK